MILIVRLFFAGADLFHFPARKYEVFFNTAGGRAARSLL